MREKHHCFWLWIVVVGFGAPALYVASFGPAFWVASRIGREAVALNVVFQPLMRGVCRGGPFSDPLDWYAKLASAADWDFTDLNDLIYGGDMVWGKNDWAP